MGVLEHILAELTAYGCLAVFGWMAVRWLFVMSPKLDWSGRDLTSSRKRHNKQWLRHLPTLACLIWTGLCVAPTSAAQQLASAPAPQPATISGTVLDTNGGIIPGARVVLNGDTPDNHQETAAGDTGFFQFTNVQPGAAYHVTVTAPDFADWTSTPFALTAGQYFLLSGIQLRVATVQTVVVAVSSEEIATEQVKVAEKQRVLGFIPNFYVNFDRKPVALTPKLKFQLALRALNDPVTIAGFVANASIYQAADYPSYRGGMAGYGQRLGATFAGGYTHLLVGGALLPSLLHQDPRFFYKSSGTTRSKVMYAFSSAIFTTGDSGRRQINYSGIGGDLVSGAVANAYYPTQDRGAGLVIRGSLIGTGGRIAYALAEQFVLNRRHRSE